MKAAVRTIVPRPATRVLGDLDAQLRAGRAGRLVPVPTGFEPLDSTLGGGLRLGEMTLVGGQPGVGKTVLTLQWARGIARAGGTAIYACYEHDEETLLARLVAQEIGEGGHSRDDEEIEFLRTSLRDAATASGRGLDEIVDGQEPVRRAFDSLESYGDRLVLVRASGTHTGVPELAQMVADVKKGPVVLFVDYLQKVAARPEPADETEKVTRVSEALKDLALDAQIAIVAVVAADREALDSRRLALHHLRGSSALAYESDVVLMLNEKFTAVSKVHLAYDPVRAAGFRSWTLLSVEKNRSGPTPVDLEFRKDFAYSRFEPQGGMVAERLADEKLGLE